MKDEVNTCSENGLWVGTFISDESDRRVMELLTRLSIELKVYTPVCNLNAFRISGNPPPL